MPPLGWRWVWLGTFLPLTLVAVLFGRWSDVSFTLGQLALVLVASAVLVAPRQVARWGIITALMGIVLVGMLNLLSSAVRFSQPDMAFSLLSFVGASETIVKSGSREWMTLGAPHQVQLSLDARKIGREGDPGWVRSEPAIMLEPRVEDGRRYTRVIVPQGKDPYLMRSFDMGEPIGGRTFRAQVALRSDAPVEVSGRRGLWLQVWDPAGGASVLPVALDQEWRRFVHEWTVPIEVTSSTIRLVLNDFDELSFDVRDVVLDEWQDGEWRPLGVTILLQQDNETHSALRFIPEATWQHYSLELKGRALSTARTLRAALEIEPHLEVEVRSVKLKALDTEEVSVLVVPKPPEVRQHFGHAQVNLAGHSLAASGLMLLSISPSTPIGSISGMLSLVAVLFSGSRAAFAALLVGVPWLLWLSYIQQERQRHWALLATISIMGFIFANLYVPGRMSVLGYNDKSPITRPEIWGVAWQAIVASPLGGVGIDGFDNHWSRFNEGGGREIISHAHNLWLALGSSFGLIGLLSSLWLTFGILYLAWYWGRWWGTALVVPILVMNVFDYTFFYSGVLFPLIFALNVMREQRQTICSTRVVVGADQNEVAHST
jgi:hypothetical protein